MRIPFEKKSWQWAAIILLALLWGSSFILMKRGLESFTNYEVAAFRIFIAFLVLLPLAWKHFKKLKGKDFIPLFCVGLFGNFIPAYLFTKAQTVLPSALAGLLNSLVPLFTLIIGVIAFQMKVKWINVVGIIIGLVGACALILSDGIAGLNTNLGYGGYVIAATVCYALAVNIIKKYLHEMDAVILTALAFCLVGPFAGVHLFTTDFIAHLGSEGSTINVSYIAILGVFGTGAAVILFNMLIKHTTALFATTVTYLIPIVAMFWGVIDGEPIGWYHVACIAIILTGVYLVNKRFEPKN